MTRLPGDALTEADRKRSDWEPPGYNSRAQALTDIMVWGPLLPRAEYLVLSFIAHRTVKFAKPDELISYRTFIQGVASVCAGCGLRSRPALSKALKGLMLKDLITRTGNQSQRQRYGVNWPVWRRFVEAACGSADELQRFTQRTATGSPNEQHKSIKEETSKRGKNRECGSSVDVRKDTLIDLAPQSDKNHSEGSERERAQWPLLTKELTEYMEGEEPPGYIVASVIKAANGASEAEVVELFREKWNAGHRPGRRTGPQTWPWFVIVARNHFQPQPTYRNCAI